jgi:hypothetical protein
MKKYFTVPMGCRGEIEIPYVTESDSIDGLLKMRKEELVKGLRGDGMSRGEIKEYLDEWFINERYSYGVDVSIAEEDSYIYIDMESDLFRSWKGLGEDRFVEKIVSDYNVETGEFEDSVVVINEDENEERVWGLLNSFWEGDGK